MCSRSSGSRRSITFTALVCAGAALVAVIAPLPAHADTFDSALLVADAGIGDHAVDDAPAGDGETAVGGPTTTTATVSTETTAPSTLPSVLPDTAGGEIDPPTVASDVGSPRATTLTPSVLPDTGSGEIDPLTVASVVGSPGASSDTQALLPATGSDHLDRMMAAAVLLFVMGVFLLGIAHGRRRSIT